MKEKMTTMEVYSALQELMSKEDLTDEERDHFKELFEGVIEDLFEGDLL
jgi:hypothetical protein